MAPFASDPAPRWEPGSARDQFMESGPPDCIEFAVAADFLRPPPFLRPAAFFFPATLRPAFFGAAAFLPYAPFLRPFFFAAAFFGAALRPAFFFGAAFFRPPARIAIASARGCSVVGGSSLLIL